MLIVVSGHARSGKDTFAKILMDELKDGYITRAYADSLKERVMVDFNLSYEQVYGELKEIEDKRYTKKDGSYWTPREILQHIGTDAYRAVDDSFWVNDLFRYIETNNLNNVIITDGRFPGEIDAVYQRGGIHIRMKRNHGIFVNNTTHSSETALDNYEKCDYYIDNNGSIMDLYGMAKQVKELIKNIK